MADHLPIIRSNNITPEGFIEWVTTTIDPTLDIDKARATDSHYVSNYGFSSLYNLGLCRLIADEFGRVHIKGLLLLPEALVKECATHDNSIQTYLESAPPGKFGVGQIVYMGSTICLIHKTRSTIEYDKQGRSITDVSYYVTFLVDGDPRIEWIKESALALLPMNKDRKRASKTQGIGLNYAPAFLEPGEKETEVAV